MKKISLLAFSTAFVLNVSAQQNPVAMKYAKFITADDAKRHLSILASDEFEGRETGKPGAEKAANYIAAEFKKLGLQGPVKGSYFLDINLATSVLKSSFSVNGQAASKEEDFYAYSPEADREITATEVVFVGYGTESEIANTDLNGKILVWINEDKAAEGKPANTGYRATDARERILKNLKSKNPSIIIAVNPEIAGLLKRNKDRLSAGRLGVKPEVKAGEKKTGVFWITPTLADQLVKLSGKTYDELKSAATAGVVLTQTIKAAVTLNYNTEYTPVKAVDVLGFMPGRDPKLKDEVLVFSAHYDHIGLVTKPGATDKVNNGADDDGSGTTGILEIARAFSQAKKDGHGPRRSVLFLGNVGEEKGLLGSEYYTDHPVFPLDKTITDLNIDMIGRVGEEYIGKADSANYVYAIGSAMLSKELHEIGEKANNTYTKLNLDYKYDDPADPNRFYYRSDHYNFAKHGVPIIFYFNGVHADYHQPGDEVSKINFPLLAKRAQLVFYTGWELANRDKRPAVDAVK
ncbi:Zn-dependent amino-or carboxypeptidase, M28 family [Mucilaginibacter pineti]|uniref:Zn-dependent amino-or carboxypeptidase, M28 family n=1 Tax=Mucilaginibacter pineti TaxID=1391627 RepID=A0A1G7DSV0_9SPHI|nr:M28 family peptidase [Mucilaginibacter pineti]SDE54492.1 Zn-dependent amino-or carboxypeptidase, M28 family [Mucilaginibacter pineti]